MAIQWHPLFAELLRPLLAAPHASVAVQRAYVEVLIRIGYEQASSQRNVEAVGSEREAMREHLKQQQVGNEVYYPQPMHLQECFANLGHRKGDFPESEKAALTTVALPIYPELTLAQKEHVVAAITGYYAQRGQVRKAA